MKPQRDRTYVTLVSDSARWDQWRPRKGDVIVCTAPKCGTTWTQMIVALLIHGPNLPQPLTRLSRWLDRVSEPIASVIAEFEAQDFRRVVKTHSPLDGLPYWEEVDYVVCGRDPRDAFLSTFDHMANVSDATIAEARKRAVRSEEFVPIDYNRMFRMWLTTPSQPWVADGYPLGSVLYHADSFWSWRKLPNIHFQHYADLRRDLDREMRRLAAFLGIDVDERAFPALVEAASFPVMQKHGEENAPGAHLGEWRDSQAFFRKARLDEWQTVLDDDNKQLYDRLASERLSPSLRGWLERGRSAWDPKRA